MNRTLAPFSAMNQRVMWSVLPRLGLAAAWLLALAALSACRFTQVMESLPPLGPTETSTPAPPTETPAPTATPTFPPTATLYRGVQNPQNGHWYLLITEPRTFHVAQEYCRGMGAHLVTIESEEENRFVYQLSPRAWLGASDVNAEGRWLWVTGEPLTYASWDEGEPNNCALSDCAPEHYLTFSETPYRWNDVAARELPFVCEWEE